MQRRWSPRYAATLVLVLGLLLGTAWSVPAGEHAVPAAKEATAYLAFDSRPQDQLAIAVDPFDTAAKTSAFRVDYRKYGFMPLRIIVTNSGDRPVSLNDVRIILMTPENDKILAAEPQDIERRVATKDRVGTTVPIGPLKIHRGGKDADSKVEQDFAEYEYSALVVEPHTTRSGFLFYDVDGLGSNPLKGTKLVFRKIRDADGKELFSFEVPFDKYLAAR